MTLPTNIIFIAVGILGLLALKFLSSVLKWIFVAAIILGLLGFVGFDIVDYISNQTIQAGQTFLYNKSMEFKDCILDECNCSEKVVVDCLSQTILMGVNITNFNLTK